MDSLAFLKTKEVQEFISENESTDIQKLILNPPAAFKSHIRSIADQILSKRKAKTKLASWYQNESVIYPPPLSLEQCSSPATAAYKASLMSGNIFTDLTGGMGIDTLAFADAFESSHYVEMNEQIAEVFRHNARALGHENIRVHHSTAEEYIKKFEGKGHFYIDPARRGEHKSRVFLFEDCTPNMLEIMPLLREKAHRVLIKAAPMIDISLGIEQLGNVKEVHVVSLKNEVKEVLFLLDFEKPMEQPLIHCINLETNHQTCSFTSDNEKQAESRIAEASTYLYDPNSSILKAGAFKSIAREFGLGKLSINTHLYTSDELLGEFPGRIFEVIEPHVTKKNISNLLPTGKANVITKNYPQRPEEIKKKFKLKDGGDYFLIGFKDLNNKARLVLAHRAKA